MASSGRFLAAALLTLVLAACGGASAGRAARASPSPGGSAGRSPAASPTPRDPVLVIQDWQKVEVRIARLDATDLAAVHGTFQGVAGGSAIVLDGSSLKAVNHEGTVTTLATLAAAPGWAAVRPDLGAWTYSVPVDPSGQDMTQRMHLGTPSGDTVIATLPPPAGQQSSFYRPFAWNPSGAYLVLQATGIGGAGPFLDYHFPGYTFDVSSGKAAAISPACPLYAALDDGTLVCSGKGAPGIEIRPPGGGARLLQPGTPFERVVISPDRKRIVYAGAGSMVMGSAYYQMFALDVAGGAAAPFGPAGFEPDTWLPDGRLLADRVCYSPNFGGRPCDTGAEGTYFLNSDGASPTLFYKLRPSTAVVGWLP